MVAVAEQTWSWTIDAFLRAEAAGVFGGHRVELVDGQVREMVQGKWHGRVASNVQRLLGNAYDGTGWRVTQETLVLISDAPDPDCWVVREDAVAVEEHGRVLRYDLADMLLVVEVGDSTATVDLGTMADLYARAGIPNFWVLTRRGVYAHTEPSPAGYRTRELRGTDQTITPPLAPESVSIAALLWV